MPRNPVPNTRTFMTAKPEEKPLLPKEKRRLLPTHLRVSWLIVVVLLLLSGFLFYQYRQAQAKLNGTATSGQYQKRLSKLILLPQGETPLIRTVNNAAQLKSQPFFRHAANGDILFVYNQQHQAILYRPTSNMIINVQPIATTPGS